jgi:O-antigen/teichoic acid export membrane protein
VVLSIGNLFAALNGAANQVMLVLNRYRLVSLLSLGEAITNVVLSVVLAKRVGIVGVALGTTIPLTLMTFCFYIPFACRLIDLPYSRLLRRLALPTSVNALAYVLLRLVASRPNLFPNLIVLVAAGLGVFAVCFSASVLLDPTERSTYLGMLRQLALRERS